MVADDPAPGPVTVRNRRPVGRRARQRRCLV